MAYLKARKSLFALKTESAQASAQTARADSASTAEKYEISKTDFLGIITRPLMYVFTPFGYYVSGGGGQWANGVHKQLKQFSASACSLTWAMPHKRCLRAGGCTWMYAHNGHAPQGRPLCGGAQVLTPRMQPCALLLPASSGPVCQCTAADSPNAPPVSDRNRFRVQVQGPDPVYLPKGTSSWPDRCSTFAPHSGSQQYTATQ